MLSFLRGVVHDFGSEILRWSFASGQGTRNMRRRPAAGPAAGRPRVRLRPAAAESKIRSCRHILLWALGPLGPFGPSPMGLWAPWTLWPLGPLGPFGPLGPCGPVEVRPSSSVVVRRRAWSPSVRRRPSSSVPAPWSSSVVCPSSTSRRVVSRRVVSRRGGSVIALYNMGKKS